MSISLGILEDETLTSSLLAKGLSGGEIRVEFSATKPSEFMALSRIKPINAALLDLHLGEGPSGVDVATKLREENPKIGIVFLTSFEDPRIFSKSLPPLPEGAKYIVKHKIHDLSQIHQKVVDSVADPSAPLMGIDSDLSVLTDQQLEILRLLASGKTNSEISADLFLSEKTIESNISKMCKTLGLKKGIRKNSRVGLAKLYFEAAGVHKNA